MEDINLNEIADQKEAVRTAVKIPETLDKYSDKLIKDLNRRRERGEKYGFAGYDWGFNYVRDINKKKVYVLSGLNEVLNGINPELYIITGGSTVGKTTFCRQLMDEIVIFNNIVERRLASNGKFMEVVISEDGGIQWKQEPENNIGCIYFSYEQGTTELQIKSLSRYTEINGLNMNKGTTTEGNMMDIGRKSDELKNIWKYQIIYEADNSTTVEMIKQVSEQAKAIMNVNHLVIFVDYLQIIKSLEQTDQRGSVEYNISELRRLVRERQDFSVVAISSVARGKADEISLEVGKETGLIEYTADVVMNLTVDWDKTFSRKENNEGNGIVDKVENISVVKNRNMGQLSVIPFVFTPDFQRFEQDQDGFVMSLDQFKSKNGKSNK